MSSEELGELFSNWNEGFLSSYLVEITADIFKTRDPETGKPILEIILDEAKQKGTGRWTSQNALDLGTPTPTINAAVVSRIISGMKDQRMQASQSIKGPEPAFKEDRRQQLIDAAQHALYASKIISYAQGFDLLRAASEAYDYQIGLSSFPFCVKRAFPIHPSIGMGAKIISLRLGQVGWEPGSSKGIKISQGQEPGVFDFKIVLVISDYI